MLQRILLDLPRVYYLLRLVHLPQPLGPLGLLGLARLIRYIRYICYVRFDCLSCIVYLVCWFGLPCSGALLDIHEGELAAVSCGTLR